MENSQEVLCSTELTEERVKTLKELSFKGKDLLNIHCPFNAPTCKTEKCKVKNDKNQIVGKPIVQDDL